MNIRAYPPSGNAPQIECLLQAQGPFPKGSEGVQYLATPFWSRRMKVWLGRQGHWVNRKRVQRLMRTLGQVKPAAKHKVYPYLLGGMEITGPNQAWAADITYIPMARGFLYLVATWIGTAATWWPGGCTLAADFCVETEAGQGKAGGLRTKGASSQDFTLGISMDGTPTTYSRTVELKAYCLPFYNTAKGPTKPWATGHRRRCSAEMVKRKEGAKREALVYLGKTAGPSLNIANGTPTGGRRWSPAAMGSTLVC